MGRTACWTGRYIAGRRRAGQGFAFYPLIDPVVIADLTWNGQISALDTASILQEVAGFNRTEIPPIPQW